MAGFIGQALPLVARELGLFAACGLLLGGVNDLLLDLLWLAHAAWRRVGAFRSGPAPTAAGLPPPAVPGPIALFVPAWREAAVIGAMLRSALNRIAHGDYRIFVGTYPNDPETVAAVRAVADDRVRLVGGTEPGPTTKAECLNRCWDALCREERRTGVRYKAVLLHDAEDMVHPAEVAVVDGLIERFDLVQLPVLPLIDPRSRWVSGHYADEFAELHGRHVPLRQALGAAIPAAGVGCAFGRRVLARLAAENGGRPFDPTSLTEDYEIGLRLGALGARSAFVTLPAAPGEPPVAVRAFFPDTLPTAVRQKTRWITGIACAGWDRLRWQGGWIEHWMRLHDRRAVLAAVVVAASYAAMALCLLCRVKGIPIGWPPGTGWLFAGTTALLCWRLAMRGCTVARFYGWREGLRSLPRLFVANLVLILAAARALAAYRPGTVAPWDKTSHRFPAAPA